MARIKSTWTIIWQEPAKAEVVLLSAGEWMLEEPTLPQQHTVQGEAFLGADDKTYWDRAAVAYELTFSRIDDHGSPESSRNFLLSHSAQLASMRHGIMIISVAGGARYELRNAAIESVTPDMSKELMTMGRLAFTYRVRAGRLIRMHDNAASQVSQSCGGWQTTCGAGEL